MSEPKESMKPKTDEEGNLEKGETKGMNNSNTDKVSLSSSKNNTPTVLTQQELQTLDYSDFSTPARMLELAEVLVKSQLVPLKKKEDVMTALLTGKELGLPFIASVTQIYPINGRPTLGVHLQRALLLKAGVTWEKIEDAVVVYEFAKKDAEGKPTKAGTGTLEEQPKDTVKKAIDTRTTYLFTREVKLPSGKYKTITAKGSFSIGEATEAELITKDVWRKFWRRMLDARAWTNGSKEIAGDILQGVYSPSELSADYYINEQNEEVHIATIVQD